MEVCPKGFSWQLVRIGSDNDLTPVGRQVITWTNADPVHSFMYAAPGLNVLTVGLLMHWT